MILNAARRDIERGEWGRCSEGHGKGGVGLLYGTI